MPNLPELSRRLLDRRELTFPAVEGLVHRARAVRSGRGYLGQVDQALCDEAAKDHPVAVVVRQERSVRVGPSQSCVSSQEVGAE